MEKTQKSGLRGPDATAHSRKPVFIKCVCYKNWWAAPFYIYLDHFSTTDWTGRPPRMEHSLWSNAVTFFPAELQTTKFCFRCRKVCLYCKSVIANTSIRAVTKAFLDKTLTSTAFASYGARIAHESGSYDVFIPNRSLTNPTCHHLSPVCTGSTEKPLFLSCLSALWTRLLQDVITCEWGAAGCRRANFNFPPKWQEFKMVWNERLLHHPAEERWQRHSVEEGSNGDH